MTPQSTIEMYRNQTTLEQRERYPNVDWQKALFRDYAMSYNANANISGGTKSVKYFVSTDFVHENDIFKQWDNGVNYIQAMVSTVSMCAATDFQLTKTTTLQDECGWFVWSETVAMEQLHQQRMADSPAVGWCLQYRSGCVPA